MLPPLSGQNCSPAIGLSSPPSPIGVVPLAPPRHRPPAAFITHVIFPAVDFQYSSGTPRERSSSRSNQTAAVACSSKFPKTSSWRLNAVSTVPSHPSARTSHPHAGVARHAGCPILLPHAAAWLTKSRCVTGGG